MTTLTLQVTEVRFDFDDLDFTLEEQQAVVDDVLGNVFEVEVDDGYDDEVVADALVEEVTDYAGWCVCALDFRHVLNTHWEMNYKVKFSYEDTPASEELVINSSETRTQLLNRLLKSNPEVTEVTILSQTKWHLIPHNLKNWLRTTPLMLSRV